MTTASTAKFSRPAAPFEAREIPVERVEPDPGQPRTGSDPEALERLARSLAAFGQIQPITVRPGARPGHYVVVTGERRWRAAVMAGRPTVAAVVLGGPSSGHDRLAVQLVENALREDLSPADQARAYRSLMAHHRWSGRQLAESLHLHHTTVSRSLRLLTLPETLLAGVESGRLAARTASAIALIEDPARRDTLAARAIAEGLNRAEVLAIIQDHPAIPVHRDPPSCENSYAFPTTVGLVTIALSRGSGVYALMTAVTEVAGNLRAEFLGAQAEAVGPT